MRYSKKGIKGSVYGNIDMSNKEAQEFVQKNVLITPEQADFLEDSALKFSKFARNKLQERMELEKDMKSEQKEPAEVTS